VLPNWLICPFCVVIVVTLPCCGKNGATASFPESGVLRVAVPQDPKTLNPILTSSTIDGSVQRLMFEPLISADSHGRQVPMLAAQVPTTSNGGISRDGLTITYHLRPGLRWSDGVPLTSKDVAFTWRAVMNPDNNVVSRHGYDDIARIDIPTARTFVVHLRKPLASFINTFFAESDSAYDILPAHILQRYANVNEVAFNNDPSVSDGPFTFVRWVHGDRITLRSNANFFMAKPKLRGVVVQTVANENTGVNLLRTGAIDYMYQASITTYPELHIIRGVRVVWLNMNGYEGMVFNTRRTPMNDPRFRQAVAYAIDKAELVRTLTYGQEQVASEDLPDWMWASDPTLKPLPRDLEKARSMLRAARVKTPIALTLVTDTANVTHKREAVMLQSMLRDAGINIEIKTYPGDLLYAPAGMGGILNGSKFDLALWPWYAGLDPDNSSQFTCANLPPNGYNESGYCNPEMDSLQNQALSHYDRPTRKTAYVKIERLLARDNPILVFWWQRQQEALRTTVSGFSPNPTQEAWNAWQWAK
jgi:peptide/nickel transport system substrate-binding protein